MTKLIILAVAVFAIANINALSLNVDAAKDADNRKNLIDTMKPVFKAAESNRDAVAQKIKDLKRLFDRVMSTINGEKLRSGIVVSSPAMCRRYSKEVRNKAHNNNDYVASDNGEISLDAKACYEGFSPYGAEESYPRMEPRTPGVTPK